MSVLPPTTSRSPATRIRVSRGVTLRFPPGGLVIHEGPVDGRLEVRALELQLDTCVHWLEIAIEHVDLAKVHRDNLSKAHASGADCQFHLDREFKAGMQAAVAAATFFEALYAAVGECVARRASPSKTTGHRSKSSRAKVVAAQLSQGFGLRKEGTANLQSVLSEIYRFRVQAVHPSSGFAPPAHHPVLNEGVEQKFVMFGYEAARTLVRGSLGFAKILPSRDMRKRPKAIQSLGANLLKNCESLFEHWEGAYGQLLDDPIAT